MIPITKVQLLSHRDTQHPIFYCHANDEGHYPQIEVAAEDSVVLIRSVDFLFKVKRNPQTKNRVDIYMSIDSANRLGQELIHACAGPAQPWQASHANPAAQASGRMALPNIEWTRVGPVLSASATSGAGTRLTVTNGNMYVEMESPHGSHIMMTDREIHIAIRFHAPTGQHDDSLTQKVVVPVGELQGGTGEQNPISKVTGGLVVRLSRPIGMGLGQLLAAAV